MGGGKAVTLTLLNTAKKGLPITFSIPMATIPAANPQEFRVSSTTCTAQLLPRKRCKLIVQFSPQSTGAKSSSVTILDDASNANQVVPLSGTGK